MEPAFAQVGAFTLPAGSRDSVLVVNLGPGSYTAQITGVNDTDGAAAPGACHRGADLRESAAGR